MITGIVYLYSFILGSLGDFFDFLLPFAVPDVLLSVTDVINSLWYYGLQQIPLTTITIARLFFFSFTFYIVVKIVALVRLPFTWLENHMGFSSHSSSHITPGRSLFGDISSPISSGFQPPTSDPRGSSGLSNYNPRRRRR